MIILSEENRKLKGRLFPIPKGVRTHLKKVLSDYEENDGDKNADGYDRLSYLCDQERVSMEELKRIKNFFDNYRGTEKSETYKLNGGTEMRDWVNRILKVATDTVKNQKEAEELTGLKNGKGKDDTAAPKVEKVQPDEMQTKNLSNSISKNSAIKESRTYILNEQQVENILKLDIYRK